MRSTVAKVGGYLVGLAVVFAAAFGIGSAVGPIGPAGDRIDAPDAGHEGMDTDGGR